jgi:uncharacterized membrane protein
MDMTDENESNDGGFAPVLLDTPENTASDMKRFFKEFAEKNPASKKAAKKCMQMIDDESDGYVTTRSILTRLRQSRGKSGPDSAPTAKQLESAKQALVFSSALDTQDRKKLLQGLPRSIAQVIEETEGAEGATIEGGRLSAAPSLDIESLSEKLLRAIGLEQKRKQGPRIVQYRGAPALITTTTPQRSERERKAHMLYEMIGADEVVSAVTETDDISGKDAFEKMIEHMKGPLDETSKKPTYDNARALALILNALHEEFRNAQPQQPPLPSAPQEPDAEPDDDTTDEDTDEDTDSESAESESAESESETAEPPALIVEEWSK